MQKIDPLLNENNELLTDNKDIESCLFSVFFEAKHLINGEFDDVFYQEVNNIYDHLIVDDEPPQNPHHNLVTSTKKSPQLRSLKQ